MKNDQDSVVLLPTPPPGQAGGTLIRPGSLVDDLVEVLRSEIARGSLKSGRIRINKLAERFGVSPVPIREALRQLQAEGLVVFDRNREVRVVELTDAELRETFLMRMLIEPMLLREAIPRLREHGPEWTGTVEALEGMRRVSPGSAAWLELNARFHHTMYLGAGMPTVMRTVQALWAGCNSVLVTYGQSKAAVAVADVEHEQLIDIIERGDAEAAAELLRRHLDNTLEEVRRLMKEGRPTAMGDEAHG